MQFLLNLNREFILLKSCIFVSNEVWYMSLWTLNYQNQWISHREGTIKQSLKPNGTLVLQLSPWGEDPRMSVKRRQAAEKFFPVNGHKFVAKVKLIIFCHLNQTPDDRLLMNLYSVRPVETSYGALENRYNLFWTPFQWYRDLSFQALLNITGPLLWRV